MLHGSCVSERPACSRSAGKLAASAAVPGAVEQNCIFVLRIQRSQHMRSSNTKPTDHTTYLEIKLIQDFPAVTFSMKLAVFREKNHSLLKSSAVRIFEILNPIE